MLFLVRVANFEFAMRIYRSPNSLLPNCQPVAILEHLFLHTLFKGYLVYVYPLHKRRVAAAVVAQA